MPRAASVLVVAGASALTACGGSSLVQTDTTTKTNTQTRTVTKVTKPGRIIEVKIIKAPGNATAIIVPVFIKGRGPYPFIVDTGASESLVSPKLVKALHVPKLGNKQKVGVVGGDAQTVNIALTDWKAGEVRLPPQKILTLASEGSDAAQGVGGLLGSDILSTFGLVQVDYKRGVLLLGRKAP